MLTNKTVRILSLDGGGTRGFLQVYFLQRFLSQLGMTSIASVFDLVAGSSVGSILAAGLVQGLLPNDLCTFLREKSPWIFTIRSARDVVFSSENATYPSNKPNTAQQIAMLGTSDPFYQAVSLNSNYGNVRLQKEITDIFGDALLTTLKLPVVITAHNYSKEYPIIFSNVTISAIPKEYREVRIVDALMSSTAAPIYFPSYLMHLNPDQEVASDALIDGGLFQNNPTLLALGVARAIYPSAKRYCILSIGTGSKFPLLSNVLSANLSGNGGENSAEEIAIKKYVNLLNIAMANAEHTNDLVCQALSKLSMDDNVFYYRFNIQLDKTRDCDLDTSTSEFFDYLEREVDHQYLSDSYEIGQFISRLADLDGEEGEDVITPSGLGN